MGRHLKNEEKKKLIKLNTSKKDGHEKNQQWRKKPRRNPGREP